MRLVINPQEQADAEKRERDRNIGEAGKNERAPAAADIRRGQHALHHVLIGAVRGHGDEGRSNQAGENRVLDFEHPLDFIPAVSGRIETGGNKIGRVESAVPFNDFVPAAGNGRVEQTERDERAADHDRSLDEISPDDGFDSAERGVDRGQDDDRHCCADVNPERFRLPGARRESFRKRARARWPRHTDARRKPARA